MSASGGSAGAFSIQLCQELLSLTPDPCVADSGGPIYEAGCRARRSQCGRPRQEGVANESHTLMVKHYVSEKVQRAWGGCNRVLAKDASITALYVYDPGTGRCTHRRRPVPGRLPPDLTRSRRRTLVKLYAPWATGRSRRLRGKGSSLVSTKRLVRSFPLRLSLLSPVSPGLGVARWPSIGLSLAKLSQAAISTTLNGVQIPYAV